MRASETKKKPFFAFFKENENYLVVIAGRALKAAHQLYWAVHFWGGLWTKADVVTWRRAALAAGCDLVQRRARESWRTM
jgi:hypothetical protein